MQHLGGPSEVVDGDTDLRSRHSRRLNLRRQEAQYWSDAVRRRLCATVRFIAVLTLINMFPAFAGKPEPDMNGWDPFMDTIGCGHKEGVAWSGHTAGTPNGFCGETYEYAYGCNKVTKC
jgi:hypothetical protein